MTDAMEKPPLRIKSVAAWDQTPVTQNLALKSSLNSGNDCRQDIKSSNQPFRLIGAFCSGRGHRHWDAERDGAGVA